jgi:AcrR family transcriptional regulator
MGVSYVDQETRRRQLIDATVEVIAAHGVDGATTRRIAETAGAPLASIHYTFGSKEELLAAAVEQLLEDLDSEMRLAVAGSATLAAALDTVMAKVGDLLDESRYALLMADIPGAHSDRMLEAWRRYQHIGHDLVQEVVDRSGEQLEIPVEQAGRLMIAAIDGVLERHVVDGDHAAAIADLAAFGRAIARLAISG